MQQFAVAGAVEPQATVEARRRQLGAGRVERHRVDAGAVARGGRGPLAGLQVVDRHRRRGASDRETAAARIHREREDLPVLALELPDQSRVVGDQHLSGAVHPVVVGHAVLAADDDRLDPRVPDDRGEFAAEQVDVLDEGAARGVDQLRGTVAADGDDPSSVAAEDDAEHPVLVVVHPQQLAAAGRLMDADRVVGATDREPAFVRRHGEAEQRVVAEHVRDAELSVVYVPDLDLAEARGRPTGGDQPTVLQKRQALNALGDTAETRLQAVAAADPRATVEQHLPVARHGQPLPVGGVGDRRDHRRLPVDDRPRRRAEPDLLRRVVCGPGRDPVADRGDLRLRQRFRPHRHRRLDLPPKHLQHPALIRLAGDERRPAHAAGREPVEAGQVQLATQLRRLMTPLTPHLNHRPDISVVTRPFLRNHRRTLDPQERSDERQGTESP